LLPGQTPPPHPGTRPQSSAPTAPSSRPDSPALGR
jgi:hypothetical protein